MCGKQIPNAVVDKGSPRASFGVWDPANETQFRRGIPGASDFQDHVLKLGDLKEKVPRTAATSGPK